MLKPTLFLRRISNNVKYLVYHKRFRIISVYSKQKRIIRLKQKPIIEENNHKNINNLNKEKL